MTSYVFDIGEKARKVSRFIGTVRSELQYALSKEKAARKLTQQDIATLLEVNRSVINRQLTGTENLTLRRVAELAWAIGWDIEFRLRKHAPGNANNIHEEPPKTGTQPPLRPQDTTEVVTAVPSNRSAFVLEAS